MEFAILIVKLSNEMKKKRIDFDVVDQIRRSGTSVGANVREAKASSTKRELARFYDIALRSANETDFWHEVIKQGYGYESALFDKVKVELNQIEKVIAKISVNLKSNL